MDTIKYHDANIAYFSFKNKINEDAKAPDTKVFLEQDGSIDFNLKCSLNFGAAFQKLLKDDDWYLYLTVLSNDSALDEQIYLDQIYGPIPNEIGAVTFGVGFPVRIDGKLIKQNNIRSLDVELAIANKTDEEPGFNIAVKNGCFFKTVIPIWSN
ncbi:hypothetical protein QSU93_02580 [Limosilactobacillus fermentum]|uniref:hypothetical protein n=1 Tax=Limosilactobacillus fermentum TaxID=1613 RepID=UPI00256FDF9D|nr:hypothetical protein [Limosilactobacillus fermentum]WJD85282.1 hypothetical protein QSU93_02580 [Limosilactobacillus fermentum]